MNEQDFPSAPSPVPYFVLALGENKARALFTVPTSLAGSLTENPVMCRDACFTLMIDTVSQRARDIGSNGAVDTNAVATTFISTDFYSPDPEGTAEAIAQRLALRITEPLAPTADILGM